ncbi:hypothetical protein KFE25_010232 [Diacronema lutheri]|uniref:Kinesin-like protein n=1 Tax=Diacronema lutheri TaxID=2081491 RepID=A0A8J5XKV7_DIALT|nr:hypothetical protein KFE25_010232 [Diacronema lutheri]
MAAGDRWGVVCRLRSPPTGSEGACVVSVGGSHTLNLQSLLRPRTFFVGHAVDSSVGSAELFERIGGPGAIARVLAGEDAFVVACGQAGTGKTKAMLGEDGLVRMACERLLSSDIDHSSVRVAITFAELCAEDVRDLLSPAAAKAAAVTDAAASAVARHADAPVVIFDARDGSARLGGLTQMACREGALVRQLVLAAQARRQPGAHFVVTISLEPAVDEQQGGSPRAPAPRLVLADLASAPHPLHAPGAQQQQRASGPALRALLDVVLALGQATTERSARKRARLLDAARVHADSPLLLRLIAPALRGQAACVWLCTLSPLRSDLGGSLRTMRLAAAAAQVDFSRLRSADGARSPPRDEQGGARALAARGAAVGSGARQLLLAPEASGAASGGVGVGAAVSGLRAIRPGSGIGLAAAARGLHLRGAAARGGSGEPDGGDGDGEASRHARLRRRSTDASTPLDLSAQLLATQRRLIDALRARRDELAAEAESKDALHARLGGQLAAARRGVQRGGGDRPAEPASALRASGSGGAAAAGRSPASGAQGAGWRPRAASGEPNAPQRAVTHAPAVAAPASRAEAREARDASVCAEGARSVSGYLTKQGGLFPTWKRRFVRLEGQTLSYFAGPHAAQPIRAFRLGGGSAVLDASDANPLGFDCVPAGLAERIFHFRAPTLEARRVWVAALRDAAPQALGLSSFPLPPR